jgi:hypothetical protein
MQPPSSEDSAAEQEEWLIELGPWQTEYGVMPPILERVTDREQLRQALAAGGVDVSEDPEAWRRFARAMDAYYQTI